MVAIQQLLSQLWHVFYYIVFPMLLLAGVGFVIQRKLKLDMPTMTRLNFYYVMPGIIFTSVVESPMSGPQVAQVVLYAMSVTGVMLVLAAAASRVFKVPIFQRRAMILTVILFNSGNYAMPLLDRAFHSMNMSDQAVQMQAFVMITQNIFTFTIGILIVAGGQKDRHWGHHLKEILKFPSIYALAAGLLTVQVRNWLGPNAQDAAEMLQPFWASLTYIKQAFFAIALGTLGAQLATVKPGEIRYPVRLSVILRLVGGPLVGLAVIYMFGFTGFLAQVLLLASCSPTALNCMLLCMEFKNQPEYAARAVFYSTIISPVTVTIVVFLARGNFLPGFAM